MGNCQAADTATVVIQHPDGRAERTYWSLSASQAMDSNPGHYVAVIINMKSKSTSSSKTPVRYLKLLRPDDILLAGHVYRLVSFEEVLRFFGSKKHVRLSRLLARQRESQSNKEARGRRQGEVGEEDSNSEDSASTNNVEGEQGGEGEEEAHGIEDSIGTLGINNGMMVKRAQWRPSLQSIDEVGNC